MVFNHIEETEVVTIINSLINSSPGCDGISAVLVKSHAVVYQTSHTYH